MTNIEKIKAMSSLEIAKEIYRNTFLVDEPCKICPAYKSGICHYLYMAKEDEMEIEDPCISDIQTWLESEATEDKRHNRS